MCVLQYWAHHSTPLHCGKGMLMIPLPSSRKTIKITFLEHINSIDPNIRFTSEDQKEDGSIPFLDVLIIPEENGKLNTTVYRKPTHTDMYLHWDSHHNIPSKYSVIGTLYHRANTILLTVAIPSATLHIQIIWSIHPEWQFHQPLW